MRNFLILLTFLASNANAQDLITQDQLVYAMPIDVKLKTSIDIPSLNISWIDPNTIILTDFHMPCKSRMVTSHYGYRKSFKRMHYGTDIKVYTGDSISSTFDGVVSKVANDPKGYGKYIIIKHKNGLETLYAHLSKQLVKEGDSVEGGEVIGLGGNTGRSTGSHLHFETRVYGKQIDPETIFSFEAADVLYDVYNVADNTPKKESTTVSAPKSSFYKVKKGDTLAKIAKNHKTTVDKICRLNNIKKTTVLKIGQVLKVS